MACTTGQSPVWPDITVTWGYLNDFHFIPPSGIRYRINVNCPSECCLEVGFSSNTPTPTFYYNGQMSPVYDGSGVTLKEGSYTARVKFEMEHYSENPDL